MTCMGPGNAEQCESKEKEEPKLRHEFVGMMFALAAGEVALQVAALLQQTAPWCKFLPAYAHLTLAIVVIAASWVGWTLSPSPGARKDVQHVLGSGFIVLLIDVASVICYFALTRDVDFHAAEAGHPAEYHPSAQPEAKWILAIFCLYFIWDICTKGVVYLDDKWSRRTQEAWFPNRTTPAVSAHVARNYRRKLSRLHFP